MTCEFGLRHTSLPCRRTKGDSTPSISIQGLLNLEFTQATLKQIYQKTLSHGIELPSQ
jgi:hypothetical protein